jgi:hypothetical protein
MASQLQVLEARKQHLKVRRIINNFSAQAEVQRCSKAAGRRQSSSKSCSEGRTANNFHSSPDQQQQLALSFEFGCFNLDQRRKESLNCFSS